MSIFQTLSDLEKLLLAVLVFFLFVSSPVKVSDVAIPNTTTSEVTTSGQKKKPVVTYTKKIETSPQLANETLSRILYGYHSWGLVEIDVEKRVSSEWKPQKAISRGKIFYSKGRIRWEISDPEKTWLIYDGKTVWNVQFPNEDFNESKNKVLIAKVTSKNRNNLLLVDLLDSRTPSDHFVIKMEKPQTFFLEPKKASNWRGFKNLSIKAENFQVVEISYDDDIDNRTELFFIRIARKKEKNLSLFTYKVDPSKDDVVEH